MTTAAVSNQKLSWTISRRQLPSSRWTAPGSNSRISISRKSPDGDQRRLDACAQAEQQQSRHNERSRDHRDERPYRGSDGPGSFVSWVFVRSIHELCFCTFPDNLELIQIN